MSFLLWYAAVLTGRNAGVILPPFFAGIVALAERWMLLKGVADVR
jgi:hypothetical protein